MASKISTTREFRRRQKVVAAVDLPGVPAGTPGKVWYVAGVTWIRCHVVFENGVELANVDGGDIVDRKTWDIEKAAADRAALAAEREAASAAARAEALADLATESGRH